MGRHKLVGNEAHWQIVRQFQIDFLLGQGLLPSDYLLDVGCGTLRGGIPIIKHLEPGHYVGIDVREEVLVEARRELAETALEYRDPTLILCKDDLSDLRLQSRSMALTSRFDLIWCFLLFQHLTDGTLASVLQALSGCLAPGGRILANAPMGTRRVKTQVFYHFPSIVRPVSCYADIATSANLSVRLLGATRDFGCGITDGWVDRFLELRRMT